MYDNTIISIDANGNVKALKEGKTTVSLKSDNGVVATLTVVVTQPKEGIKTLNIRDGDFKISVNGTKELSIFVEGSNIRSSKVWSSSNSNILEVDSNGTIYAKKAGNATVTVKLGDKSASIKVNVITPTVKVTALELDKKSVVVKMGSTERLNVKVKPENAKNKSVTWKSTNDNIATINNEGTITGISKGKAKITVFSNDDNTVSKSVEVTVTGAASNNNLSKLEDAKSYKKIKIIKTLDMNNLKKQIAIPSDGSFVVGQGFAASSKYYVAAIVDCHSKINGVCVSNYSKILFYDRNTKKLIKSFKTKLGHTNSLTTNPNTNKIYVTPNPYEFSYKNITSKSTISPKIVSEFKSSIGAKAIAYDKVTNQYYLAIGNWIHVYNSNFQFIKKFSVIKRINQDCTAYKGLFLCGRFSKVDGTKKVTIGEGDSKKIVTKDTYKYYDAIDVYRVSDGKYIGSININTRSLKCENSKKIYYGKEIESLDYLGSGNFALYYNSNGHCGNTAAYIYTTSDLPIN